VAAAPENRHDDAMELALALELEAGAAHPTPPGPRKPPLQARDPVRFWQAGSLALLLLLALSVALRAT
jgi:hypothetical protein